MGEPEQEPGGVEVAGAGGVDDLGDRMRVDDVHLVARHDQRALLAPCERRDLAVVVHALQRVVELSDLVQRRDLDLVREQHVDVVLDELEELVAVPVDAEAVGQRERHPVARVVRGPHRAAEGILGVGLVPEVALEVEHLRARHERVVEIVGPELRRRTEVGVERALGVGGDDDEATAGGHAV